MVTPTTSRHVRRRRIWTVVTSSLVTTCIIVGYVAADIVDIVPGVLTNHGLVVRTYDDPKTALAASSIAENPKDGASIDAADAEALIARFASQGGIGDDFSIDIMNAQGESVASRDAQAAREPASTLKTLTSLAAASTLDMGSTISTSTYLDQASDGTVTLTLRGNGDMLLGSGANDSEHINGRAGLATLAQRTAQRLRQRGITSVRLTYDDTIFGTKRSPATVADNNPGNLYYTPVSSMAIDGGRQWGDDEPSNPDVFESYPELSTQTALDTANVFATRLREQGIAVDAAVSSGTIPDGISALMSVQSATLSEIMAFMLRHSDNTLAELFGRLTALQLGSDNTPQGAVHAVQSVLDQLHIDTTGLTMADCSGLSTGSLVSAATLAQVQVHNITATGAAAAAEGLSLPGMVGTAQDRLADASAAGLLRVKTGTLDTVTSMAGNVSRSNGGVLAFAVIVNDPEDMSEAKNAVDTFIADLTKL